MKIVDSGTLQLQPEELITVSIQKTVPPYDAAVDLRGVPWTVNPEPPNGLQARGAFVGPTAGAPQATLTLVFDFLPDGSGAFEFGDRYEVVLQGLPSEDRRVVAVFAGGLQSRSFVFRA